MGFAGTSTPTRSTGRYLRRSARSPSCLTCAPARPPAALCACDRRPPSAPAACARACGAAPTRDARRAGARRRGVRAMRSRLVFVLSLCREFACARPLSGPRAADLSVIVLRVAAQGRSSRIRPSLAPRRALACEWVSHRARSQRKRVKVCGVRVCGCAHACLRARGHCVSAVTQTCARALTRTIPRCGYACTYALANTHTDTPHWTHTHTPTAGRAATATHARLGVRVLTCAHCVCACVLIVPARTHEHERMRTQVPHARCRPRP
jgi:hypothetical protein